MEYSGVTDEGDQSIALRGRFTFSDYPTFRALLTRLERGNGKRHVFDLSALEYVDSAALGMLLIARDEADRLGWSLALRNPVGQVQRTLRAAALSTLFSIEESA